MNQAEPETPPNSHAETDAAVQRVIDELVASGRGHAVDQLAGRLVETLRVRNLPEMPAPWVRAVAESAAAGNPYVLSPGAARTEDPPAPTTRSSPYGIS